MKRIICAIFVAVMVLSLFAACKNPTKEKADDTEKPTGFDISGYTIVRSDAAAPSFYSYTSNFKKCLFNYTGADLSVAIDSDVKSADENKEILLGKTNRKESLDAYALLKNDNHYIVESVGNKIVIIGKTDDATVRAMKDFLQNNARASKGDSHINLEAGYQKKGIANLDSIIFDNFTEFEIEGKYSVHNPGEWVTGIIQYPSIVRLSDGTLLATYENYGFAYNIHRSTDDGKTWEKISSVKDTLNKEITGTPYIAEWMPMLYELPVDMGEYKAGTVILAGTSKNEKDSFDKSTITLHASTDKGLTWNTICNVDEAPGIVDDLGIWEPFLIYEAKRGRLYCFYSDDSGKNVEGDHDQKLVYKYTTDLKNWYGKDDKVGVDIDPKEAVACDNPKFRPGMISIADMGKGGYIMTYEMVGLPDLQTHCKKTMDLDDWGDVSDYGKPVACGKDSFGSSSWCAWTPEGGGDCGTLVVVGKHPSPYYSTTKGAKMLLSFDYGETFVAIDNPIPYNVDRCGYSPCLLFSQDGKTLYYVNNPLLKLGNCQEIVLAKIKIR